MNLLEIIYCIGAMAIGAIIGVVTEYMIDVNIVKDIHNENMRLALENEQLKQELQTAKENRLVIVSSSKKANDVEFGGF